LLGLIDTTKFHWQFSEIFFNCYEYSIVI